MSIQIFNMKQWTFLTGALFLFSCGGSENQFDAQGTFEADEVMVAAETTGRIIAFNVREGDSLAMQDTAGKIEDASLSLQREQVEASLSALKEKTVDASPQLLLLKQQQDVQQTQLQNLEKELSRAEWLLKKDAATEKQVDDLRFQLETVRKQIKVTTQQMVVFRSNINNQNRAILSESAPLKKRWAQLSELHSKSWIINPVSGTVITSYAEQGEMAVMGKPLYKIADLSELTLRVYVTGDQLAKIKLNQPVKIFVDKDKDSYTEYAGTVNWISSKAEFTPKTIQTKDERANLVYAIKVRVRNDGLLKIGMYGEVKF